MMFGSAGALTAADSPYREWAVRALLFGFLGAAAFRHGVSTSFALLLLAGVWALARDRIRVTRMEKILYGMILFYLAAILLSFIHVDDWENTLRRFRKISMLALFPLIYGLVSSCRSSMNSLVYGSFAAGISFATVAIYETVVLGLPAGIGPYNQIMFGSMAAVAALFALGWVLRARGLGWKLVAMLALSLCIYASILSTSRGAWMGLIAGIVLILGFNLRRVQWTREMGVLVGALALSAAVVIVYGGDVLIGRVTGIVSDWRGLTSGEDVHTSLGERWLLWRTAIDIWLTSPLIGAGFGDFPHELAERMISGESEVIMLQSYSHSIYLESLGMTGALGLAAMLAALVFGPLHVYWVALKEAGDEQTLRDDAIMGLALTCAFAVFGLTENWSSHSQLIMYFVVLQSVCLSSVRGAFRGASATAP